MTKISEPMRTTTDQAVGAVKAAGYEIYHITRENDFSIDRQNWLKDGLIYAFPDLKMSEYFSAKPNWFKDYDHLVYCIEDISGDIVGLLAARWVEDAADDAPVLRFLHATTQFIVPRWQGTSMLRNIWKNFLSLTTYGERGFPELIVLKTCNPLAFRPMRTFARVPGIEVYPQIDGSPQVYAMGLIAKRIASRICSGQEFDVGTGVIKNVSTPPDFYSGLPSGKPGSQISYYFHTHLTCQDRVLCITHIKNERARSIVLNAFAVNAA